MPGVEDATMVDTIGRDNTTGEYKLLLTEYRPWESVPGQLLQFVVKAANYIKFIRNGELVTHVPDANLPGCRSRSSLDTTRNRPRRRRRCSINSCRRSRCTASALNCSSTTRATARTPGSGARAGARGTGRPPPSAQRCAGRTASAGLRRTRRWISCSRPHGINYDCGSQLK